MKATDAHGSRIYPTRLPLRSLCQPDNRWLLPAHAQFGSDTVHCIPRASYGRCQANPAALFSQVATCNRSLLTLCIVSSSVSYSCTGAVPSPCPKQNSAVPVPAPYHAAMRRARSSPPLTASPFVTVPDSPAPRSCEGACTSLAPVLAAPATDPMPECSTEAPHRCPSPHLPAAMLRPSSLCPPWLRVWSACKPPPSNTKPRCGPPVGPPMLRYVHALISRLVQCALRHGSCLNCRAATATIWYRPTARSTSGA